MDERAPRDRTLTPHVWRAGHVVAVLVTAWIAILASAVMPGTGLALAAAPNGSLSAARVIGAKGISERIETSDSGTEASDPTPSCNAGQRAAGTAWYVIRTPRRGAARVLRVTALGAQRPAVVALYAISPLDGTELTCSRASAAAMTTRPLDHVLARGLTYVVLIGSQGATGDTIDVRISVDHTKWRASAPIAARRQGILVVDGADGAVYSFGGFQTSYLPGAQSGFHSQAVNRRDPVSGTWTVVAQLPVGLSYGRAVRIGGRHYLPGGQSNLENGAGCINATHHVYNERRRSFSTAATYTGPATYDYAASADPARRSYYMVGGVWDPTPCDGRNDVVVTGAARVFDTRRNVWLEIAPLNSPRRGPTANVLNGWLYVAGGLTATSESSARLEAYDPAKRIWYRGADMPVPVYGAASGVGWDTQGLPLLYVAGGWTHTTAGRGGTAGETGVTQVYNPRTNRWSVLPAAVTPRDALGSAVVRGHLFAVGGFQGQAVRAVEHLNIDLAAPKIVSLTRHREGGRLVLRVRASDAQSGIASATWRISGRRRTLTGMQVRIAPPTRPVTATVIVHDWAGNTTRRSMRL